MKILIFSLLSLSILCVNFSYILESSNNSKNNELEIESINGDLYEYQKYQLLYIKVNRPIINKIKKF